MKRKQFIRKSALVLPALALIPGINRLNASNYKNDEPISGAIVKEFVIAGHNNLDKVKEMLANTPNLLNCRYDWGQGDFEEAIEGAAHLGNKVIANYLIEQGARVNLFTLTTLGKSELVIPILEAYPKLINAIGAHGFTLLHHAKVGGDDSLSLLEYLQKNGLKDSKVNIKS